jgi:glycosyltransferase involved in cell wall biosynthesis
MSLSIVIPTYNRPGLCLEQLFKIKSSLSGLVLPSIDITVLNNASTCDYSPVEKFCSEIGALYHYSAANTGFNGNYCRAICSGHGEYLWIISDDDKIHPRLLGIVYALIQSRSSPDLISFSHHLGLSVYTGLVKSYIAHCSSLSPLAISELTLVTNLVFRRNLFDWHRFWCSEPFWFPHAYSVIGSALALGADIVVLGSSKLVSQTGNTEKERSHASESIYNVMLKAQFQRGILEFINMCISGAGLEACVALTDEEYIKIVTHFYGCNASVVIEGMGRIDTYVAR